MTVTYTVVILATVVVRRDKEAAHYLIHYRYVYNNSLTDFQSASINFQERYITVLLMVK